MTVYEKDDPDWYFVENSSGTIGLVPSNYVEETTETTVSKPVVIIKEEEKKKLPGKNKVPNLFYYVHMKLIIKVYL